METFSETHVELAHAIMDAYVRKYFPHVRAFATLLAYTLQRDNVTCNDAKHVATICNDIIVAGDDLELHDLYDDVEETLCTTFDNETRWATTLYDAADRAIVERFLTSL